MSNAQDLVKNVPGGPRELLTKSQLSQACPALKEPRLGEIHAHLNVLMLRYGITSPEDVAAFIATCGHESLDFTVFSENMNYSADALKRVFPKYFKGIAVEAYARNPKAIGSRVYANRMGNGDEKSGEGYVYRGAGAIQLTGKKNIGTFALAAKMPIDQAVAYLRTPSGGIEGACWFWSVNNLNRFNFQETQGLVNVGRANATTAQIVGWNDRIARYTRAKKALGL